MKIFFDSEFTGLHQNTTIISLGIVSEDDRSFYAEFNDYNEGQIDEWLEKNVIDNLVIAENGISHSESADLDNLPEWVRVKGNSLFVKHMLLEWFEQFDNIELWSDCLAYDWVLLSELVADRKNGYPELPKNFSYHSPYDILVLFKMAGINPDIGREKFLEWPDGENKHNALWDARVIKACYEKLTQGKKYDGV